MCGICGFSFDDRRLVKRMSDTLKHRGPDDSGNYNDSQASLGHRRLSIIDLSRNGRQPMSNEEGDIWITFNGEIYNYKEIKERLEKRHEFKSNSDTEVLIHAYEEYGLKFLEMLRGMFAFCIYDSRKGELILVRDNIGKKPLYYHYNGRDIVFASEVKAILEYDIDRKVNNEGLISYLAFYYTIGTQTIIDGIKKLQGGHFLVFDLNTRKMNISQYWDVKEEIVEKDDEHFIKELRGLLEESASLRLRSDVPVGAFLSGGVDSSISVAYARDKVDYDFHTFSMGFETYSEFGQARRVAEHLDTRHHEISITGDDVIKILPDLTWHNDEPVGESAIISNYFLAKEARKHVKVVLAGEAGDELFAGYGNYKTNLRYHKTPFAKPLGFIGRFSTHAVPSSIKGDPWMNKKIRMIDYLGQKNIDHAHLFTTRGMHDQEMKWLMKDMSSDSYNHVIYPPRMKEKLNSILALDLKNILPEKFLMKADKATMANGVEERLILMDKEIVEFSYRLPPRLKIRDGYGKWILKKAGEDRLKGIKDILWEKKRGFGTPIDVWINGEMRDYVLQGLESEFIRKNFRKSSISKIASRVNQRDVRNYHQAIVVWTLFALGVWYERFF